MCSMGLQTLHGRYPLTRASLAVAKYSTFSRFGLRAEQVGRQKIPVVFTPVTKMPSYALSRLNNAVYIISVSGREWFIKSAFSDQISILDSSYHNATNGQPKNGEAIFIVG